MPAIIDPIRKGRATGAVIYDYVVKKADGSPGEVQSPPVFTAEPEKPMTKYEHDRIERLLKAF